MTKKDIHRLFSERLESELKSITAAAKDSFAMATNMEHQAKNRHDTFKLEASFLARGQAMRVEELTHALESFKMLPIKTLKKNSPVQLGALVTVKAADKTLKKLFICSAGGGETVIADGEEISIITPLSPLGKAILGKLAGDTFSIKIGPDTISYTVQSIE